MTSSVATSQRAIPRSLLVCAVLALTLSRTAAQRSGGGAGGESGGDVCGGCDAGQCPPLAACPGGITWDECGCCETCAKSLGEECGGPYGAYGKCGLGLTCLKDSRECPYLFHPQGAPSTGHSDVCRRYLFNAIGRCVQERRLRIRGFSLLKGK